MTMTHVKAKTAQDITLFMVGPQPQPVIMEGSVLEKNEDTDPGSARFGNFINYYDFHPAETRIRLLPNYVEHIHLPKDVNNMVCLDVGCNTGELTVALYKHLTNMLHKTDKNHERNINCEILATDLDEVLIERARLAGDEHITFHCVDVLSPDFPDVCDKFLKKHNRTSFDIIFCFSMTMWIHINHGDEELNKFITSLSKITNFLIIEPQPWKCYTRAVRRLKRSNEEPFKCYTNLKIRKDVETHIEHLLSKECSFSRVLKTAPTSWGRQVSFYKANTISH